MENVPEPVERRLLASPQGRIQFKLYLLPGGMANIKLLPPAQREGVIIADQVIQIRHSQAPGVGPGSPPGGASTGPVRR